MKWFNYLILLLYDGARSRNRTGTTCLGSTDFKSVVSTYFTIRAMPISSALHKGIVKRGGGGADFNRPV